MLISFGVDNNNISLVHLRAQLMDQERSDFLKWCLDVHRKKVTLNLIPLCPLRSSFSFECLGYLQKSAHAQTKYGSHFGIRDVSLIGRFLIYDIQKHRRLRSLLLAVSSFPIVQSVQFFTLEERHRSLLLF